MSLAIKRWLFILLLIGLALARPAAALADDPLLGPCTSSSQSSCVDCSGAAAGSAICSTDKSKNIAGNNSVLLEVTNFMAIIAGIAAVIMLVVGGMKYVLAGGEAKEIASAKNTVIYALVGIVVIVVARELITFIVSRL